MRLTFVLTHPVQYFSPWFRYITAERSAEIDLTVLYGAVPTPEQQGIGFGTAFSWDVPVTDGHRFVVCAGADPASAAGAGEAGRSQRDFSSDSFFGVDVPDIAERIAATSPDAVIVPGWHSVMQTRALRWCRRRGVPVLYRGDSTLESGPRWPVRPLWAVKTRLMLRQFDAYLAVGRRATEYLRAFGVGERLIYHSPHCVDNDWFAAQAAGHRGNRRALREGAGARDDDFVVLFAGKFVGRKRPLDAVRVVAGLGPRAVLMMAGDGPLADEARNEAARLGIRLHWRGFLNQSALPEAFAASDALLVPSTWESWGLIVNEALASGVPCVVTSGVAAAPDLVTDGSSGYTVPVGDVSSMTTRLAEIRDARAQGHDFAPACRQHAAACSFEKATDGVVKALRSVVPDVRRVRRQADRDRPVR
jgi:glycosyltransferase involved in cell wall biosynthesis